MNKILNQLGKLIPLGAVVSLRFYSRNIITCKSPYHCFVAYTTLGSVNSPHVRSMTEVIKSPNDPKGYR